MNNLDPYGSFHEASNAVLEHLHSLLGFDLWMVTRTEGEAWIVLDAADYGYGIQPGDVFSWADSFCSRMVEGRGPRIAPSSDLVPSYASAPIGQQVPIGAYVGVPLGSDYGEFFGTLCAIHPTPRPDWIKGQLHLVELFGRLLSSMLKAEIRASEEARKAERAEMEALTDSLTGLYNRRGWDQLCAAEESRCRRYGHPACLFSIDIDNLKTVNDSRGHSQGDELIRRAATAIASTLRPQDVAARLGGDEFAVLAVECDLPGSQELSQRLRDALSAGNVAASMGVANCQPNRPFTETWESADQDMYASKRSGARSAPSRG